MTHIADKLSLQQKTLLMAGKSIFETLDLPSIGLGSIRMADGPMGITSGRVDERDISLLTPCGTSLAASWDRDLATRIGQLIGQEALTRGVQVVLGPNLNLPRSPLAGRSFETLSEDPLLTSILGVCWIHGVQQQGVGATAKHLVANDSETNRDTMNSVVDERALREVYLLPFEYAARAGVWAIMTAYNRVNGTFAVENPFLITQVLRNDWNYDGVVMCDWFGTHNTLNSVHAGLDLEMPGPPRFYGPALATAVEEGKVSEAQLETSIDRILTLAANTGKYGPKPPVEPVIFTFEEQKQLLKEAAAAGFVLLKNANALLPLDSKRVKKLAVIGPNAFVPCYQGGTFARINVEPSVMTPLDAIRKAFEQSCEVVSEPGVPASYRRPPLEVLRIHPPGQPNVQGLQLDIYAGHDSSATPLATEVRNTSSLVWFGAMPGLGALDKPGMLKVTGLLLPDVDGEHTFYVGGTGEVRLLLDGVEVIRAESELTRTDLMGALKRGDSESAQKQLTADHPLHVQFELRFKAGRAHGFWFGCRVPQPAGGMERAVALARAADAVVLVLGETQESALESVDRRSTYLPENQVQLLHAITAANPRTVVALNVAHAVDASWANHAGAVLMTWFPGQEFGPALASVLKGELEPGGRLPVTFAANEKDYPAFLCDTDKKKNLQYTESNLIGYRSFAAKGLTPRYEFGAGFGYASFAWSDFQVDQSGANVSVRLTVTNTAHRAGKEVVQLYVEGPDLTCSLQEFAAVTVQPGQSQPVNLELQPRAFSHWSVEKHGWHITPGTYHIMAGKSVGARIFSAEILMSSGVTV